jgi:hypothetical protein
LYESVHYQLTQQRIATEPRESKDEVQIHDLTKDYYQALSTNLDFSSLHPSRQENLQQQQYFLLFTANLLKSLVRILHE